jgi:uncharacterized membrane protein YphA (DoxX/SURF4 family)
MMRDSESRSRRAQSLGVGDPQSVTRGIAGAQVGAGALLALGRFPRLSSLVLAATVVPDSMTGHAFWSEGDKSVRTEQRRLFVRDLGLLGGLLVSVADTGGRESVPHRTRRTARKASRKAAKTLP